MTRIKWMMLLAVTIVIVGGYFFLNKEQPVDGVVVFSRQGVDIALDRPKEIEKVTVKNENGQLLAVMTIGPGVRQKIPVFMKWEPDKKYVFELMLAGGHQVLLTTHSPAASMEKVSFTLQAPYGMSTLGKVGVVPADSPFTANILLTNHTDQPIDIQFDLEIPSGVEVMSIPQGMRTEMVGGHLHIVGQRRVSTKNEHWNEQLQLKVAQAGITPEFKAKVTLDNGEERWQLHSKIAVQVATIADISSKICIQEIDFPVDFNGRFDPKASSGSLVYAPPSKLSNLAGAMSDNRRLDDEPFAYASIHISNNGDDHVLTLVSAKIIDPANGALAPAFKSPAHKNAGLGYSYGVVTIAPHSVSQVVLPVYLNENDVVAGSYRLRAEATVFGVNQTIASSEKDVHLVTRNDRPVVITLLMALIAMFGTGWLLWRQEAALSRFTTKELVIISLFGTVTFVTVNLPQNILWDIAHAVFGPFSFLFTGFFSQTILYALIIALAIVLPRPGAVTLMIIVRFILNGFIFGHFTPLQLLSYAALAVCLEGALYAAGVTRNAASYGTVGRAVMIAIACGLVDIVTTYMNFMAYMTLYRLFYADWYISAVLAAGFLYTASGAAIGCRLGSTLRCTAMD